MALFSPLGKCCVWLSCAAASCSIFSVHAAMSGQDGFGSPSLQVALGKLYGLQNVLTVPIAEVRRILENPPNIQDAIFAQYVGAGSMGGTGQTHFARTNVYRCAWSSNGYCLAVGLNEPELASISARGDTMGRFGSTNWRASGNTVVTDDGVTDNEAVLGKERSSLACEPLRLGIAPLVVRSVHFYDDTHFGARSVFGQKLKGRLISYDAREVSGIAYEVEGIDGWSYIVTFYRLERRNTDATPFPVYQWASFSVGPTETNLMGMTVIAHILTRAESLSDGYFHPSQWITEQSSIPVVEGHAASNQLLVKWGGKLIPAASQSQPQDIAKPSRRTSVIIFLIMLTGVPFLFGALYRKRKLKSAKSVDSAKET